jgi:SAM-dependent methyltransferase
MNKAPTPLLRLHLSVGLLSVAIIAFQLVLMQILSITQWHHFAYMVVSVALLGFGASGSLIALARDWLLERSSFLLPLLMFGSAAAMATVVEMTQTIFGGFDSYLLFVDASQVWRLLLVSLLFSLPFFLGALAIGLVFVQYVNRIGTFYFANLFGSGLGGIAGIALLELLPPPQLPAVTALFSLAAGLLIFPRHLRRRLLAAALLTFALTAVYLLNPPPLSLSEYKDLQRALNLPGAHIVAQRSSPYGLIQIVSSPALRHAPGISLTYDHAIPVREAVFSNGNWFGAVPKWSPSDTSHLLDYTTGALPYAIAAQEKVLILNAGTGTTVAHALVHGAKRIVAVEPHSKVLDLLEEQYDTTAAKLLRHPKVTFAPVEPRTHLATDASHYDLILLPTLGTFGGTAGLFALQEHHTFTKEALVQIWRHLAPDGILCVSAWMDYPARNSLRLLATIVETLAEAGIDNPTNHLAAVRGWGTITFCVKRSLLTPVETQKVREFCNRMLFDPALLPDLDPEERERYHLLEDQRFFRYLDQLLSPERRNLYAEYGFRLQPTTDNRPFFSQFLRWQSLPHLASLFGEQAIPFIEMGYLIVVLTFFQMAAAALVLIILPLFRLGWRSRNRLKTLLYFGGLGAGYMLVEMVLIHRFVLYLGHPVYAAASVICAVLVFSGAGSYASSHLPIHDTTPHKACGLVTLLILLYTFLLPLVLQHTIAFPMGWKILFALLLLAPLSFAMGLPFPLGLQRLARFSEPDVPWAWGINGCFSVLSTALATIIAVEAGFAAALLLAALAYGTAVLTK